MAGACQKIDRKAEIIPWVENAHVLIFSVIPALLSMHTTSSLSSPTTSFPG